jgi:hypothetical protein
MITVKLLESVKDIERNINKAIVDHINDMLLKSGGEILRQIKAYIPSWLENQPELQSLSSLDSASLAGQFGIVGGGSSIKQEIVSAVSQSISAKLVKFNTNFVGGLEIYIQPTDFANLLTLSGGHTIYQGGDLHWLDWLLTKGDAIVISNYQYNAQTGLGRSGLGNMIAGGSFRVPPQFSGTPDNNFVTRALVGAEQEKVITKIFQDVLS